MYVFTLFCFVKNIFLLTITLFNGFSWSASHHHEALHSSTTKWWFIQLQSNKINLLVVKRVNNITMNILPAILECKINLSKFLLTKSHANWTYSEWVQQNWVLLEVYFIWMKLKKNSFSYCMLMKIFYFILTERRELSLISENLFLGQIKWPNMFAWKYAFKILSVLILLSKTTRITSLCLSTIKIYK